MLIAACCGQAWPEEAEKAQAKPAWLAKPVKCVLDTKPLPDALREFCMQQGVSVNVSEKVAGTLSGSFAFENPLQFLEILARNNGLVWYFDGQTAYFTTNDEMQSQVLRLSSITPKELVTLLRKLEIWDDRFPARILENERIIYISGPPRFISLVKEVSDNVNSSTGQEKVLEVFSLKYASADDQTLQIGDKSAAVPGVATMLKQIVFGKVEGTAAPDSAMGGALAKKKGTGLVGSRDKAKDKDKQGQPQPSEPDQQQGDKQAAVTASILADARLNAVIIWDLRERMGYYRTLIEKMDRPVALVEIRAAILDVETDHSDELGINWSYSKVDNKWTNSGGHGDAATNSTSTSDGGIFSTVYTNGLESFLVSAKLLEEQGDANILSRPAVLTFDNIQAVLSNTETFYVKLQGNEEVDMVDVTSGTVLQVTPHIVTNEGGKTLIKMVVHIEDGSDSDDNEVDSIPRVVKTTIDTQAVIGEGEALVIGGHYKETRRKQNNGIPVLSHIPGMGKLFTMKTSSTDKVERLFVLTPKVMTPEQQTGKAAPKALVIPPEDSKEMMEKTIVPELQDKPKAKLSARESGKSGGSGE